METKTKYDMLTRSVTDARILGIRSRICQHVGQLVVAVQAQCSAKCKRKGCHCGCCTGQHTFTTTGLNMESCGHTRQDRVNVATLSSGNCPPQLWVGWHSALSISSPGMSMTAFWKGPVALITISGAGAVADVTAGRRGSGAFRSSAGAALRHP